MREKLLALTALHKIDSDVAALKKSAESYPKQLAELEKELTGARSLADAERSKLTDLETQRQSLEQTISDEKEKIRKWEARLTEQRSTREYSSLAREIDIAKKNLLNLSEDSVGLVKTVAAQKDVVKAKTDAFIAKQGELSARMTELRAKVADVDAQVKVLESGRGEKEKVVDPALLKRYEVVRKKRMPGMCLVSAPGICQGCRMNIPPQTYNTLRNSLGYDICPSCHRIIYCVEAIDGVAAK